MSMPYLVPPVLIPRASGPLDIAWDDGRCRHGSVVCCACGATYTAGQRQCASVTCQPNPALLAAFRNPPPAHVTGGKTP